MVGIGNPSWGGGGTGLPGVSANPGGRSKELAKQQSAARLKAASHSIEGIAYLVEVMRNKAEQTQHRLKAATELLNRGLGTPQMQVDIDVIVSRKINEMSLDELRQLEERLAGSLTTTVPLLLEGQRVEERSAFGMKMNPVNS
jgi:hypothetical protein